MNYVEAPADGQVNQKHLQQGQIAILADAIGPTSMIEFSCRACDHNIFSMVADTVLMLDIENWVRGLPAYAGTRADQDTMRLSPVSGINITFDRYVMTIDGFMPRRDLGQYRMRKMTEVLRELSEQGKLFVARSEVNGRD